MAAIVNNIVGHSSIIERLTKSLQEQRFHPVHMFIGPSSIGKLLTAQAMAQNILCKESTPACGTCAACRKVQKFEHENLKFIKPEGLNIKIEQAREVIQFLNLRAVDSSRVIIIDDADKMNPQTANALLKTFEEPPENDFFFLITATESSMLPTIRSRSQKVLFAPLSREELKEIAPKSFGLGFGFCRRAVGKLRIISR